jgi:Ser/Thr protein kinase RdoA (MazF antagonist)
MFLSNEVHAGRLAAGVAPAVFCHVEHDEWHVVGFEYVPGRPADLSPDSADLDRVGRTLDGLSERPAGDTRPLRLRWSNPNHWRTVADRAPDSVRGWDIDEMCRWSARAPKLVDGERLLHTDLHRDQFLITEDGRTFVIDWAFPAAGAPWVDTAFLSLRLTASGHTHAEAQQWASGRAAWATLDGDTMAESVTAWSVYVAGLWSWFAAQDNALLGARRRARLARDHAAWCLAELTGDQRH